MDNFKKIKENNINFLQQKIKNAGKPISFIEKTPIGEIEEIVYYDNKLKLYITSDIILKKYNLNFKKFTKNKVKFIRIKYNGNILKNRKTNKQTKENEGEFCVYFLDNNMPILIYSGFNYIGYRLAFLHELYHSFHPTKVNNMIDNLSDSKQDLVSNILNFKKKPNSENGQDLACSFEEYIEANKMNAKEERNATAWALCKIRELRKKGIDLEPNLKTFKEMEKYIHDPKGFGLGTYEKNLISELKKLKFNKQIIAEISGIYSKKTLKIINKK